MTEEHRLANIADTMLEVIDFSDNGVSVLKVEEIMMQAVSFRLFIRVLNMLKTNGLIEIDANHVMHRVRS